MLIYLKIGNKYLGKITLDYVTYKKLKSEKLDKLFILKNYLDSIFEQINHTDISGKNLVGNHKILENNLEQFLYNFKNIEFETVNPEFKLN